MKKIDLIAVVGPTASGKSAVSIEIAKRLDSEIINCDSMQIYKEMNIGTAKIRDDEKEGIPHHLLSIIGVSENYSVANYSKDATAIINKIKASGKIPIMVGGTGLYIDSVVNGVAFTDEKDDSLTDEYKEILKEKDAEYLHSLLREIDNKSAEAIHPNNTKRVIRAIVATKEAGIPFSKQKILNVGANKVYNTLYIGLQFEDRETLYQRINSRVDLMLEQGLLSEAKKLYNIPVSTTAAAAIGYKELFLHFDGEISFERAVELIKQRSRNYAKRQLTWFRKNEQINWLNPLDGNLKCNLEKLLREYNL